MSFKIKRITEQPPKINFNIVGCFGLYSDGELMLVDHSLVDVFDCCFDVCGKVELIIFSCLSDLSVFDLAGLLDGLEGCSSIHNEFLIKNGFLRDLQQYIGGRSRC